MFLLHLDKDSWPLDGGKWNIFHEVRYVPVRDRVKHNKVAEMSKLSWLQKKLKHKYKKVNHIC